MINDFQIALIAIVGAVILLILLYNFWQERKYRRNAEDTFGGKHRNDVLLDIPTRPIAERVEPMMGAMPDFDDLELDDARASPTIATLETPRETAVGVHAGIDSVALVLADKPITPEQYLNAMAATEGLSLPVIWEGLHDGLWQPLDAHGDEQYRELRAGLQLADRRGARDQADLTKFQGIVQAFATSIGAVMQCEDIALAGQRARALDEFCAGSDVEIVIHVVGKNGVTFAPVKVQGQAEARGLQQLESGEFAQCTELGAVLFTVRNMDPAQPPGLTRQTAYFSGISFALDVPRTPNCVATFERMFSMAMVFADVLQGEIVDDNKRTLTASAKKVIADSIGEIAAKMQANGIEPGSHAALRLYQ